MWEDIRDKPYLTHEDVLKLNFIKAPNPYRFRRHYRAGLRSHIMEILNSEDLEREKAGVSMDGLRSFPRARPVRMLRIFRTRFRSFREAAEEPRRVKILESYLAPINLARSDEFIVDYVVAGKCDYLLCGLQEYVEGEILNPWRSLGGDQLLSMLRRMQRNDKWAFDGEPARWIPTLRDNAATFLGRLKEMILKENYVPDLAGVGNLILTRQGHIRLVDINNVSRVPVDTAIPLDDRGYPVCDKSIEALSLLEEKLLGRVPELKDPVYEKFLLPERMKEVKALENAFHLAMNKETPYSQSSSSLPQS